MTSFNQESAVDAQANNNNNDPLASLSKLQQDRYYSISHRYGLDGIELVKVVKGRGKNSWPNAVAKSDIVNRSEGQQRKYYQSLTDSFETHVFVSYHDVVQTVSETRSRLGLDPFTESIISQCINEFATVFVFEEETLRDDNGKSYRAVKPLFALLAE
jgi:hypothetical protein